VFSESVMSLIRRAIKRKRECNCLYGMMFICIRIVPPIHSVRQVAVKLNAIKKRHFLLLPPKLRAVQHESDNKYLLSAPSEAYGEV
jgi:hypothetical protein